VIFCQTQFYYFIIFPLVELFCVKVVNRDIQDLDLEWLVLAGLELGLETNGFRLGLGNSGLGLACGGLVTSLVRWQVTSCSREMDCHEELYAS